MESRKLLDIGLERINSMLIDMAELSELTVSKSISAYTDEKDVLSEVLENSRKLKLIKDDIGDLCVELIARFQPVASDLRQIRSYLEISSGLDRFGRYAYDISQVLDTVGDLSMCDKTVVKQAGLQSKKMMKLSIKAFTTRQLKFAEKVKEMDEVVDNLYRDYFQKAINSPGKNPICDFSTTLVLRYLERIADHATYISDSVIYVKTGKKTNQ
jgi:phosphate transport system protein